MNHTFQSSKQLLSILIRLSIEAETSSTRIHVPHYSNRCLPLPNPRHLTTSIPRKSQPIAAGETAPDEADVPLERTMTKGSKKPVTPVSSLPEEISRRITSHFQQKIDERPQQRTRAASSDHEGPTLKSESRKRSDGKLEEGMTSTRKREDWQVQKDALKQKFGETGWSPRKKLSPDTLEGIRALHEQFPDKYTTPILAEQFKVSPEAIRRILKCKWRPSPEKMEERRARWAKRHDRIWDAQHEMGLRPKRTKDRKPEGPEKLEQIIPLMPNPSL